MSIIWGGCTVVSAVGDCPARLCGLCEPCAKPRHIYPSDAHQGAPSSHLSKQCVYVGVGGTNLPFSVPLHLAGLVLSPAAWRAWIPSQALILDLSCSKNLFRCFSSHFCLCFSPMFFFSFNDFLKADGLQTPSPSRDIFSHLKRIFVIWRVFKKTLLLWGGTYTQKCTLCGDFNPQACSTKRLWLLIFMKLSHFSALDLRNIEFWGSISVFNPDSFWTGGYKI